MEERRARGLRPFRGGQEMDPPSQLEPRRYLRLACLGREPRCPEFQKATSALLHVRCSAATACVQRAACKEQGLRRPRTVDWLAHAPERALGPTCSPSAARAGRQRTFAVCVYLPMYSVERQ